jgi:hypothetical protein
MNTGAIKGIILLTGFLFSLNLSAAVLDVRDGILFGASDVRFSGLSYSVAFRDSTCLYLYNGCDQYSDLPFENEVQSFAANQALLEQVLIDTPSGLFDSTPGLTHGCSGSDECSILTPMHFINPETVSAISAYNHTAESRDLIYSISPFANNLDLSPDHYNMYTYAVWSPTPVPLPGAVWLFGSGLVAVSGFLRKNRPQRFD